MAYRLNVFMLIIGLMVFSIAPLQAAMIDTEHMMAAEVASQERAELQSLLQRDKVQSQLTDMGG